MEWEYLVESISIEPDDLPTAQAAFDKFGSAGWDLVHGLSTRNRVGGIDDIFVFKRPVSK